MNENKSELKLDTLINELSEYIKKLVESFREGKDSKGYNLVLIVIDKLEAVLCYMNQYNNISEKEAWVNNLNNNLLEIIHALENKDYILLSDLFEYEITPLLNDIKNNIILN